MGVFLDSPRFSLRTRAVSAYVFIMSLIGGCWVWGTIIQREYTNKAPALDWTDSGFGRGWALYILWQTNWALTYNLGYWIIGSLAREPADVPRLSSYIRALESAGQTISSGISSTKTPVSQMRPQSRDISRMSSNTSETLAHHGIGHQLWSVGPGRCARILRDPSYRRTVQRLLQPERERAGREVAGKGDQVVGRGKGVIKTYPWSSGSITRSAS